MTLLVFGWDAHTDQKLLKYLDTARENFKKKSVFTRLEITRTGPTTGVFIGMHVFPRIYRIGYAMIALSLIFAGATLTWAVWTGLGFIATGYFWSGRFFFAFFKRALRRNGYPHAVQYVGREAALQDYLTHIEA